MKSVLSWDWKAPVMLQYYFLFYVSFFVEKLSQYKVAIQATAKRGLILLFNPLEVISL